MSGSGNPAPISGRVDKGHSSQFDRGPPSCYFAHTLRKEVDPKRMNIDCPSSKYSEVAEA